jgi:two-component system KDP operon response regulator KdpE
MTEDIRLLIVDDEKAIRDVLKLTLAKQSYKIFEAETGEQGIAAANTFHPHLIILDLGLPDQSGLEVLKKLRAWTSIPILILTVDDNERTKVELLDAGADDYLTKPFGPDELLARIRVSLRNRRAIEATPIFESQGLVIDLNARTVFRDGSEIKLTTTEFELLKCLVRDQNNVVPQAKLLTDVWGPNAVKQPHYLRIYIALLRKKIERDPSNPQHIQTESGVGYRLA